MKKRGFDYFIMRYGQIILFVALIIFIVSTCSGCCHSKILTQTTTEIDTVFINPVIDTIKILKEYQIKKDTLIFDTINIENKFSKVKIFPVNGKIEVELVSKPFETVLKASKTIIQKEVKQNNNGKFLIFGFVFGFLCCFCILQFIKLYLRR